MTADQVRAQWDLAIAEWQRVRCADWHPQKAAAVDAARQACAAARTAYYASK